jgi:hypothetical protein
VRTVLRAVIFGFVCSLLIAQGTRQTAKAITDKDGFGILVLPDGSKFKTTLYGLKVIGELRTIRKLPYYIVSGVGCDGCDANTSIYIHSPSDGPMKNEGEQQRFAYPGREADYQQNRRPVYEARVFFGDCLTSHPNAVIWFERFVGDDWRWHSGVRVAEVTSDSLVVKQMNRDLPIVGEAVKSVSRGRCQELPGTNRFSEP